MPFVLESVAVGSVAASSSGVGALQPLFVLIIIGIVLLSSFIRAASRKRRANQASPYTTAKPAGRATHQQHNAPAPYTGTLLNGVPLRNYDTSHAHEGISFANERMKAEAELKRQLDALDTARRNGQVTPEQYTLHREAIFRNF